MRRKVKQLLATGMALAVLATNLMPVSLAAETAEELQTGEVATQALTDEIDARAWHSHSYVQIGEGFHVINKQTGAARPYVELKCMSTEGICIARDKTCNAWNTVAPYETTEATCSQNKVFHYAMTTFDYFGTTYTVGAQSVEIQNSKNSNKHNYEVTWEKGTADENGTGTMYLTVKCKDCKNVFAIRWPVTASSNEGSAATCEDDATYKYGAGVFSEVVNGKSFTYDEPVTLVAGKKLGHDYSVSFAWTDHDDGTAAAEATIKCSRNDVDETKDAVITKESTSVAPGCLTAGTNVYTASVTTGDGKTFTSEPHAVTAPATGHSYGNNCDVQWDDSTYKTATLTWECDNEGCDVNSEGHFKSETLTAVEKVTKPATCTDTGKLLHEVSYEFGGETMYLRETTTIPALGHNCSLELKWDDDTCTSATATVKCSDCDYERDVPVTITAVRTEPTCTEIGYIDYTATADVTYDPKTEGRSPEKDSAQIYGQIELPALGHSFTNYVYNGDATCGGDGTETAKCDRCDVTDTRTAVATAGCDLHTVDGAKVCAVCGKVNGQPKLAAAEANADVNASTIGAHLVVRVGTLPTGQKVITVAFLNNDGQAVRMFGTQKIHVSLAQLKAALGDTEGTGFEHTLTRVNTANGEKQNVGFTVENGTVNFDAAFNGSTACILLVD